MARITAAFALRASKSRNSSPSVSGGLTSSQVRPPSVVRNTKPGRPSVALPPVTQADKARSCPSPRMPWWPELAAVATLSAYAALPRKDWRGAWSTARWFRVAAFQHPPPVRVVLSSHLRVNPELVEACFEASDGAFHIGELVEAEESDP